MGKRVWNVTPLRGKTAVIEIVDDSAAGWGHILVDEIVQWRAPAAPGP